MNTVQAAFGGRNVIGFDLGHAHTTLATMSVAGRELKILEISKRKVQTTALKRRYVGSEHQRNGSTNGYKLLFGDRVFNHTPPEDELHISFKRRPSHDPIYQKNMAEFFASVLSDIDNSGQLQGWSQTTIIVGCPSAWSEQERAWYQQLLTVTGYPQPLVISESRAALLHTIVSEEAQVKLQDFDNTILVVDVGSSTVDFTLIHGMKSEEPLADFGDDIGGAFFDQAIYDYAVAHHPQPEQLRSLLALNRNLEPKLLYLCRKAKEKYFDAPDDFEDRNVPGFAEEVGTIMCGPIVNGAVMAEILAKPTKSGKPWISTFAEHLQRAKQIADAKGKPVRVIILTGGAARMHFVKETIDAIFPDSKLFVDSEPENSVAKGLAVWGRGDILVNSFRAEVDRLFATEIPALLRSRQEQLLDLLTPTLADKVIDDFVTPGIFAWKRGQYESLASLKAAIAAQTAAWLSSVEGQQLRVEIANRWWNDYVRQDFQAIMEPVCAAHDVPVGSVDIRVPFQLDHFSHNELDVPIPLGPLLRIVAYIIFWAIVWVLPLGGPILAAFITLLFKDEIDRFIDNSMQQLNLPVFMRSTVSDNKIQQIGKQNRVRIAGVMKQKLMDDAVFMENLNQQLVAQLRDDVERAVQKIARRLYSGV